MILFAKHDTNRIGGDLNATPTLNSIMDYRTYCNSDCAYLGCVHTHSDTQVTRAAQKSVVPAETSEGRTATERYDGQSRSYPASVECRTSDIRIILIRDSHYKIAQPEHRTVNWRNSNRRFYATKNIVASKGPRRSEKWRRLELSYCI